MPRALKLSVPAWLAPRPLTPKALAEFVRDLVASGEPQVVEWLQQLWGKQSRAVTLDMARAIAETGMIPPELERYIQDTTRAFVQGQLGHLIDKVQDGVVSEVADFNGWDLGKVGWTQDLTWRVSRLPVELSQEQMDGLRLGIDYFTRTEPVTSGALAERVRLFVGLTERDAGAVANARQAWAEAGVPPGRIEDLSAQYSERLQVARAQRIARTEQGYAANEANHAAIQEAIDSGELEGAVVKVWNAALENTCEDCLALDGTEVPWGEEFKDGPPPIHPNCMCVVDMVELARK